MQLLIEIVFFLLFIISAFLLGLWLAKRRIERIKEKLLKNAPKESIKEKREFDPVVKWQTTRS